MLEALADAAEPRGLPALLALAGAAVEQGREGEGLVRQRLVAAQRPADERDLVAGGGQGLAKGAIIGKGEERGIDDENLHVLPLRSGLEGFDRARPWAICAGSASLPPPGRHRRHAA